MIKRAKFIALVGGEGSGKGTISSHLQAVLQSENVMFTREPGGTELGEKIRTLLLRENMSTMTELLLFEASRAEHIERVIVPALIVGRHVISDRFDACTYAYQVYARWQKKHADFFKLVNSEVVGKFAPDLYLFCDVSPEVALNRRLTAGGEITRFDNEELEFHNAVYRGYKEFLKDRPCIYLDAGLAPEVVKSAAEAAVRTELGL